MKTLRVGLVGCGGMGSEHLKIAASLPGVELAGVCDQNAGRAEQVGHEYGIGYWDELDRFLDEARPEVLHICSPTGLHGLQGIAAAERGIHILCEKPLDIDLARVDTLIALCELKDLRLGCIFQKRSSPAVQAVRKSILSGDMGSLISCSVSVKWWRSQEYYDMDDWRGTWALDGGCFSNQGIHSLDLMVCLAGAVEEVEYAHLETRNHRIEAEDFGIAVVRFANGARGTIEVTTCCHPEMATRLEIYGTNGSAAFDDAQAIKFGIGEEDRLATLPDRGVLSGGGTDPWAIDLSGHREQIADFYAAVREKRPPLIDGREARLSLSLLHMIYEKAFRGKDEG